MADFYQSNSIATLHRLRAGRLPSMEAELDKFSRKTGMGLILPALITEFERPAMRKIVDQLREARYYSNIVVAIGRANRKQVAEAATFFRGFRSPVTILWVEDPRVQEVFQELERAGMPAKVDGKGRTCWLSMGYLLAEGQADVIALHDCDIENYTREIPAALCYPLAHPQMEFDFCKGYYARISEKLHGRVTRLFLAPLLETLREHTPDSPFLSFLSEFRYPLAGEFAMKSALARKVRLPADWGLEVGVLSEVFQHAGAARACQADIADNYEHKHQELSAKDPSKGLRRMTFDIAGAMIRCLGRHGIPLNGEQLERVANAYTHHAGAKVRQYEADALMNGLDYNRGEEIGAVNSFGDSLHEAIAVGGAGAEALPAWSRVEREAPGIMRRLMDCAFEVTVPARVAMPNWLQSVPKPAYLARAR
ncbi:MAG: glycosyl transferase [Bryobacteraceae bacterium]